MSEDITKRLFIGNISVQLAQTLDDLTRRLEKFGKVRGEFELHHNEVKQISFGYINMTITDKEYIKLKSSLHGVNFKGSKLIIDIAKEDYKEVWARHHNDTALEQAKHAKILKQQWEFFKKIQNINKSFQDRQQLIKGRMRVQPRKEIKKMTFRIKHNGEIKFIRCYKTKLWGYEKNKKLRDLVYKFQNGVWKDGNDHIVERLNAIQLKQGTNRLAIERVHAKDDESILKTFVDDEEEKEEIDKNNQVLASILGSFDFDKQLDYKEEIDEFGESDYEYEGPIRQSDDEEESPVKAPVDLSKVKYIKEGEFNKEGSKPTTSSQEDDDEDDDIYERALMRPKRSQNDNDEDEARMEMDESDEDTEFMPSFGQTSTAEIQPNSVNLLQGTVSNTETLRGLFNSNEEGSFKLIEEDDDDIDQSKTVTQTDMKLPEYSIAPIISRTKNKNSLFFTHLDSPFLVAQTQVNKLNSTVDFGNWGEEFWEKRSEWTSELKRRRRDVMRQMRKKNAKNSRVFV